VHNHQTLSNDDSVGRKAWRHVCFGDVVRNADPSVRDPLAAGIERFVGLDHLDAESLRIRRWGQVAAGTTFTRRFVPGQILFGKRRAYQRKVAVADFDGICSGDILVFEPTNGDLLPELLPFIVQSEGFFQHALGTSAGSLSPRTRWSDLAKYEFLLPPKAEQRRIAEILWSIEHAKGYWEDVATHCRVLSELVFSGLTPDDFHKVSVSYPVDRHLQRAPNDLVPLGELLEVCQYGLSLPLKREGRYPVFRMTNLEDGLVTESDLKYVDLADREFTSYKMERGDILFNRTNSMDLVGKVGIYLLNGDHVFASYLIRIRVQANRARSSYVNYYLNSQVGQKRLAVFITPGVSQANINAENLKRVSVPLPGLDEQDQVVALMDLLRHTRLATKEHIRRVRNLKAALLSRLLPTADVGASNV
jgi:type I restriction enzyme, S subunit